jgi:hypothetical protein
MSNSNLWSSKPWWCQPWTIILTGVMIIAGSWLFHTIWLTLPIAILIVVWWTYFLIIVPRILAQQDLDQS